MLKILIVDDEADARTTLISFIKKYYQSAEVIGEVKGVQDALALMENNKPDVLLLDIRLADGTGFDLLDKVKEKGFDIIFTTAYNEYALKAIKYSASDYLLKPIDPAELIAALGRVEQRRMTNGSNLSGIPLNTLIDNLKNPTNARLAIPDGKGISFINPKEIITIRSNKNFSIFSIINRDELVVTRALKEFEEMLSNDGFYRIHNTCIINFNHVTRYVKGDGGGTVIMSDQSTHEIARRRKEEFLELLNNTGLQ